MPARLGNDMKGRVTICNDTYSDECLLGLSDEFQVLHVLGWVEDATSLGARTLVCHGSVALPDLTDR